VLIIGSKGLSTIKISNPTEMVTLRKSLKEFSLHSEERAVTSALRKFTLNTESSFARNFAYLSGGFITDFGADPWRSLMWLFLGIPVFASVYIWTLKKYEQRGNSNKRAGVWVVWPLERINKTEGDGVERLTSKFYFPKWQKCAVNKWFRKSLQWLCLVLAGFYFSLLSAFHFGWRELSVGTWLSRLQPREYTLRATGWVRVVSGFQSILSIYLLAWWALTYFGRPFE
jgi:hypothetical protein